MFGFSTFSDTCTRIDDKCLCALQPNVNTFGICCATQYNLNIESLHWEPDEMPDKSGWHDLEHILADKHKSILIWEAEPLPEISKKLNQMGVKIAVFELSANTPEMGNFISKMEENIKNLENAIK